MLCVVVKCCSFERAWSLYCNICGSLQGLDCGKCEIWMGSRVTVNGTLKEEIRYFLKVELCLQ